MLCFKNFNDPRMILLSVVRVSASDLDLRHFLCLLGHLRDRPHRLRLRRHLADVDSGFHRHGARGQPIDPKNFIALSRCETQGRCCGTLVGWSFCSLEVRGSNPTQAEFTLTNFMSTT